MNRSLPANLKILHVLDHSLPLHSGYTFRTLAILREQRRLGWQTVHLTTPKHTEGGPDPEDIEGFRFRRTRMPQRIGDDLPVISEMRLVASVARRIAEIAQVERPDILHAHSPVLNTLACLKAGGRLGLPVVAEVRAFWEDAAVAHRNASGDRFRYRLTRSAETYALRRSDAITTICEGLKRDIVARDLPEAKITVIPNGVDLTEFPRADRTRRSSAAEELQRAWELQGKTVLGFFGSFYHYEGIDLLLAALPEILGRHPEVCLLLAGGGPEEQSLRKQMQTMGLGHAVRFAGRIPHPDIRHCYELADLFVFPRRATRLTELTTPLKPLEAMASGGIVIASDVGGHRELIRHRETGYLFRPDDPAALAEVVAEALDGRDSWAQTQDSAWEFVRTQRTWAVTTMGYSNAYARALASRSMPMSARA
jgi:PEP-CTERM/exosortase A-associated glycosyltransferase